MVDPSSIRKSIYLDRCTNYPEGIIKCHGGNLLVSHVIDDMSLAIKIPKHRILSHNPTAV